MGESEAPFFGVSKKEKREERRKKYVIPRSAERRACGVVDAPRRASPQPLLVCVASARRCWRDNYVELLLQNYKCASFETWGVGAEVKKVGSRDKWYVEAAADMLAAGRGELRKAIAEFVREALARGWIDASKAEG